MTSVRLANKVGDSASCYLKLYMLRLRYNVIIQIMYHWNRLQGRTRVEMMQSHEIIMVDSLPILLWCSLTEPRLRLQVCGVVLTAQCFAGWRL